MRENYCFENGCNVHWPYWKNTCDQVCCNMSDNNIKSYDILKKFLSGINDNPDISFTSCKGLLAPSSYYTYYATRFNTHVKIDGRDERILEDSNYIGQGKIMHAMTAMSVGAIGVYGTQKVYEKLELQVNKNKEIEDAK